MAQSTVFSTLSQGFATKTSTRGPWSLGSGERPIRKDLRKRNWIRSLVRPGVRSRHRDRCVQGWGRRTGDPLACGARRNERTAAVPLVPQAPGQWVRGAPSTAQVARPAPAWESPTPCRGLRLVLPASRGTAGGSGAPTGVSAGGATGRNGGGLGSTGAASAALQGARRQAQGRASARALGGAAQLAARRWASRRAQERHTCRACSPGSLPEASCVRPGRSWGARHGARTPRLGPCARSPGQRARPRLQRLLLGLVLLVLQEPSRVTPRAGTGEGLDAAVHGPGGAPLLPHPGGQRRTAPQQAAVPETQDADPGFTRQTNTAGIGIVGRLPWAPGPMGSGPQPWRTHGDRGSGAEPGVHRS